MTFEGFLSRVLCIFQFICHKCLCFGAVSVSEFPLSLVTVNPWPSQQIILQLQWNLPSKNALFPLCLRWFNILIQVTTLNQQKKRYLGWKSRAARQHLIGFNFGSQLGKCCRPLWPRETPDQWRNWRGQRCAPPPWQVKCKKWVPS